MVFKIKEIWRCTGKWQTVCTLQLFGKNC